MSKFLWQTKVRLWSPIKYIFKYYQIIFPKNTELSIITSIISLYWQEGFSSWLKDQAYYTNPDIPTWLWISSSVILIIIGLFGITSNLTIIVAYCRNKAVSYFLILKLINFLIQAVLQMKFKMSYVIINLKVLQRLIFLQILNSKVQ